MSKDMAALIRDLSQGDFAWQLRCLMALADIRAGELSAESGICQKAIYHIRAGIRTATPEAREKLLLTIEQWKPGTLKMMAAAENSRTSK